MNATASVVDVDTAPEIGVRNSQPEGIGRLVALDGLVCWNNLGRNVVFADPTLRPRAVFGTTLFPGEDEPSQYDLDVHAVLDLPELGLVLMLPSAFLLGRDVPNCVANIVRHQQGAVWADRHPYRRP